jgi:cupin 2 domain-containing protein
MDYRRGNLFATPDPPTQGERFEPLGDIRGARIEQIVSSESPDPSTYDQAHDEWVVLLVGTAEIEVAGERLTLSPGDYLTLPAHTAHRVVSTSHGARWLAVHGDPVALQGAL